MIAPAVPAAMTAGATMGCIADRERRRPSEGASQILRWLFFYHPLAKEEEIASAVNASTSRREAAADAGNAGMRGL
jgi:hypothetical protein